MAAAEGGASLVGAERAASGAPTAKAGGTAPSGALGEAARLASAPYCDACGQSASAGDHARCRARRAATDPPRFCTRCARKLVVQVLPRDYTARCVRCDH